MQEDAGSVKKPSGKKTKELKIPTVAAIVEQEASLLNSAEAEKKTVEEAQAVAVEEKTVVKEEKPAVEESTVAEEKTTVEEKAANASTEQTESVAEQNVASAENASEEKEEAAENSEAPAEKTESASEEVPAEKESVQSEEVLDEDDEDEKRNALSFENEAALLETVLFLESEPQTVENLSKITKFSPELVEECIARLKDKYSSPESGIEISKIIGGWLLVPKRDYFDLVKERYGKKNEGRLSRAAIETLSIIAYSQPCSRNDIESIRHVNVDNMMRILLDRNFIKEVGKKDVPGKPTLYGTTKEFLEFFHLQSLADLPQLEEKDSEVFDLAR